MDWLQIDWGRKKTIAGDLRNKPVTTNDNDDDDKWQIVEFYIRLKQCCLVE